MDKIRLNKLEVELEKYKAQLKHMSTEYAKTREGSAYGCEYYEIQCRVLQSIIEETSKEISRLKKELKLV